MRYAISYWAIFDRISGLLRALVLRARERVDRIDGRFAPLHGDALRIADVEHGVVAGPQQHAAMV